MIQLATALPAISVGPVKPNAAISVDVSGFALAMGALSAKIAVPATGPKGQAGDAAVPLPEGQDLAADGKELPDAVLGLDGKSEDQPAAEDSKDDDAGTDDAPPPFAWFAIAPPPTAQPEIKADAVSDVTVETGGKRARCEVQIPEVPVAETAAASPEVQATAPAVKPAAAPATAAAVAPAPVMVPGAKPQPITRRADVQREPKPGAVAAAAPAAPAEAPVVEAGAGETRAETTPQPLLAQPPRELRKAAAEAPVVRLTLDKPAAPQKLSIADVALVQRQPGATPSPSVAEQVFAAFEQPRPRTAAAAAAASSDPQADLSTLAAPTTGTQTAAAVTATGQGQDAMLDTRHQEWTAKMIDKIEALQDGGPVRETKLSLMREGLGKVDIAIRQDDAGSLHVQFNTDTQAARQLIADAQPKLAEIAQERGIRLGSTSVESNAPGTNGGTGAGMNQGQRQDAQAQRNQPSAPPSARREASPSTQDDERVA